MPGAKRCKLHGSATPRGKAAAERKLAEIAAAKTMATYGLAIDINPAEALLAEVHRTAGHVAWIGQRIESMKADDLIWGKTEQVDKAATEYPGVDTTESSVPHVWLRLYQQERAHLVGVCKAAIAAGIEERRVRLAESQGQLMVEIIRGILGDLNLTAEQHAMVPEVVPRRLRMAA
jgi:hypothetical protein